MNYVPTESKTHLEGTQDIYRFPNGYGASVICNPYSYGGLDGLYELAVLHGDELCYMTPITEDVIGHQTEEDIQTILVAIEALPANTVCKHSRSYSI